MLRSPSYGAEIDEGRQLMESEIAARRNKPHGVFDKSVWSPKSPNSCLYHF